MKRLIVFFLFFAGSTAVLFASDFWEGNATTARQGEFSEEGMVAASNSFVPNTTLEVENIASGESVRVRIIGRVSEPGVFLVLSRDAAQAIGLDSRILMQVRAAIVPDAAITDISPSDDVPFHLDPDINPAARLGDPNLALIPSRREPAAEIPEPIADSPVSESIPEPEPIPEPESIPEPEPTPEEPVADDPVVVEHPPLEAVVDDDAPIVAEEGDLDDDVDTEPSVSVARVVPEPEPDAPDAVIATVPEVPRVAEPLAAAEPRVLELPRVTVAPDVTVAPSEPDVVETPAVVPSDDESLIDRAAADLAARTPERRVLVESRDDAVSVIDRADAPRVDEVPSDRLAIADPRVVAPDPAVVRPEPPETPDVPALAAARVDRPAVAEPPVTEPPVDDTPEPGLPIADAPDTEPLVVDLPVVNPPAAEPVESEQPRIVNGIVPPVPPDSTLVLEPADLRPPRAPVDELEASIGRTEPIDPDDPAVAAFPSAPDRADDGVAAADPDPREPDDRRPAPAAPEPPTVMPDPSRPAEIDPPAVVVRPEPPREPVVRAEPDTPPLEPDAVVVEPADPRPPVVADEPAEVLEQLVSEAYYVQIGAYNNSKAAEQALVEIAVDLPTTILATRGAEREVYRAFAGPFERDETGTALHLIRSRGVRDAFVRRGADVAMR